MEYELVNKEIGEYEFILGGDDRSSPWSETRRGLIVTVKPKKVYLSEQDYRDLKKIIRDKYKADHIIISHTA